MSGDNEIEAKFLVRSMPVLRQRLLDLGAELLSSQVHETNRRFDTPDRRLARDGRALRLRQDSAVTLTYKGPGKFDDGVRSRVELELQVDDLGRAEELLKQLGYVVTFTYEKIRTTLALAGARIMLDELPYGDFVEIEGEAALIRHTAGLLQLRWETAIAQSYLGLFERLQHALDLPFHDLSFSNFSGRSISPGDLGVVPADV